MKMLTIRVEDEVHEELVRSASAQGTSVSEVARARIASTDDRTRPANMTGRSRFPNELTTVERQSLALLHRIFAEVSKAPHDDQFGRETELSLAEIIEQGFVPDYDYVFERIEDPVSRSDAALVMDILDMFSFLKLSYGELSPEAKAIVPSELALHIEFQGFNNREDLEARLLRYAKHLIDDRRWEELAEYFDRAHDNGISGYPTVPVYRRMKEVFDPIWREKIRAASSAPSPERYRLNAEEISAVARAAVHPDHR